MNFHRARPCFMEAYHPPSSSPHSLKKPDTYMLPNNLQDVWERPLCTLSQWWCTIRPKIITLPCATKTLPTRKNSTRIIFEITLTQSELFRINFGKLPDTYCIYVSCETLPAWEPLPLSNYFLLPLPDLKFSELIG